MKKIVSLVLAVLMLASLTLSFASCGDDQTEQKLYVYTNAGFAPYEYLDDSGNVVGVDIDVMNYIGEKLGYKVIVNDVEFNTILNEVAKNEYAVGAAGMSQKASRDEVASASIVYATSVQYIIAPKGTFTGDTVKIADAVAYVEGLSSAKSIGVQKGTTGQSLVEGAVASSAVTSIEYTNAVIASNDIGTTVSAVVIDKMPAESICKSNDKLQCWCLDAEMESYVMYFNGNNTELLTKVNEILEQMIKDGKIDEFTVKHSGN